MVSNVQGYIHICLLEINILGKAQTNIFFYFSGNNIYPLSTALKWGQANLIEAQLSLSVIFEVLIFLQSAQYSKNEFLMGNVKKAQSIGLYPELNYSLLHAISIKCNPSQNLMQFYQLRNKLSKFKCMSEFEHGIWSGSVPICQ